MTEGGAVAIGPYRFSAHDVAATLHHHDDLFELLLDGVDPELAAAVDHQRAEAAAAAEAAQSSTAAEAAQSSTAAEAALAVVWERLQSAGALLRSLGAYGGDATGSVVQLNTSRGGVPKRPVERVTVGFGGVEGDVQATRRHHGRPWQALCLWSADVIAGLAAEGHPVAPGSAGENVTIDGLPWERVHPGVVLELGTVACEVQAFAVPCSQNARWFVDGDFNTIHHRRGPVSRVYATVLSPGVIEVGDPVRLRAA